MKAIRDHLNAPQGDAPGEAVTASQAPPGHALIGAARVKQVLLMAFAAMALSAVGSVLNGQWSDIWVLGPAAVLMLVGWWLANRGRVALATALLLGTLTTMVTILAWNNSGLHDSAMLAYPALLMFASILGRRDLLLWMVAFVAVVVFTLALGNVYGWHVNVIAPPSLVDVLDPLGIMIATAVIVWVMSADLHQALRTAETENARVRESRKEIEFIATHDAVTGLANRILARNLLDHVIANAGRQRSMAGLLYLDLDDFKTVNDSLGHSAGDALLRMAGARLSGALRSSDTVCRLGGDEFLIILGELNQGSDAATAARTVLGQFASPFIIEGLEVRSGCSIGIAVYPDDGSDFDTLLKNADTAMYRAKDEGRNAFRFFDAAMNASASDHASLVTALRSALARGEFSLHYQPQIELASGRIIGAEALLRWDNPELGHIGPARFIPVAEKTGLIVAIGAWVLEQACRQTAQWAAAGLDELVISVNVSPVQFQRGDIDQAVLNALHASGLRPDRLELELTESLLVHDTAELVASIGELRNMGVGLAIDDFGTGYSNLSYLKRFEVGRLKIDQSFVRRLHDNPHDEAIVKAIVQMGDSLGLKVIAEGVEDAATLKMLVALGCGEGQGYYWAQPLPADEFLAFAMAGLGSEGAPARLA
jgi:diguanylate cyclase (GGDEF)-like protein